MKSKVRWSLPGIGDGEGDDKLLGAYRKARRLLRHPYVTGVTVGYAMRNGKMTAERAICILVTKKLSSKKLSRSKIFPRSFNGVPVDVIEANFKSQQMSDQEIAARRTKRAIPAQPGVSISVKTESAEFGTLGMFVKDTNGNVYILTAAHVLKAEPNSLVYQPEPGNSENIIGRLGCILKEYDAAIAPIIQNGPAVTNLPMTFPPNIAGRIINRIRYVRPASENQKDFQMEILTKSGCVTGLTRGAVISVGEIKPFQDKKQTVNGFTLIGDTSNQGAISSGGDSGSVWYDEKTGEAVGLHLAGSYVKNPKNQFVQVAMACHIPEVFKKFEESDCKTKIECLDT